MGKAQSKRSVDITTEPSKEIQEGSGELKKLDETYFKENESSVRGTDRNLLCNFNRYLAFFLSFFPILGQRKQGH